ncbi:hypothetical protein CCMA1212_010336 [Trichoderma ghanense]|uniref:Uncharacterized protein n=1 Tax=Trichoderma ghanense TaxID=65468 RepID=A0ABY2GRJ6_9HYPO
MSVSKGNTYLIPALSSKNLESRNRLPVASLLRNLNHGGAGRMVGHLKQNPALALDIRGRLEHCAENLLDSRVNRLVRGDGADADNGLAGDGLGVGNARNNLHAVLGREARREALRLAGVPGDDVDGLEAQRMQRKDGSAARASGANNDGTGIAALRLDAGVAEHVDHAFPVRVVTSESLTAAQGLVSRRNHGVDGANDLDRFSQIIEVRHDILLQGDRDRCTAKVCAAQHLDDILDLTLVLMRQADLAEEGVVKSRRSRLADRLAEQVEALWLNLSQQGQALTDLSRGKLTGGSLEGEGRVRDGRQEAIQDTAELSSGAHVEGNDGRGLGCQHSRLEPYQVKVVLDAASSAHQLNHVAILQSPVVGSNPRSILPRQPAGRIVVRGDDDGVPSRVSDLLKHLIGQRNLQVEILDAHAECQAIERKAQLVVVIRELAALGLASHREDDGLARHMSEQRDLLHHGLRLLVLQKVHAELHGVAVGSNARQNVDGVLEIGQRQRHEKAVLLLGDRLERLGLSRDDRNETSKILGDGSLGHRSRVLRVRAVVEEVAALPVPRPPALVDFPDLVGVRRPRLVLAEVVHHLVGIPLDEQHKTAIGAVRLEDLPGSGGLDEASSTREHVAVGVSFDHVAQKGQFVLSESFPASRAGNHLRNCRASSSFELVVQIHKLPAERLRNPPAGSCLSCASHANDEDGALDAGGSLGLDLTAALSVHALQVRLELLRQHVPPARPGLADALSLGNQDRAGSGKRQDAEAHGNAVVVVAVDALLRRRQAFPGLANDLDAVLKLVADDAKLGQLILHRQDTVAFLHPLVGNSSNLRSALSHRCQDRGREKSIRHSRHVNAGQGLEVSGLGPRDGSGVVVLVDVASHGLEDLDGELGVALQRLGSNVGDRASGSRNGSHSERVRRRTGVALNSVLSRVLVDTLRDVVRVWLVGRRSDVDAKRLHHGDGHVNVWLGNGLAADQSQSDGLLGIGGGHEDGRHILGGNSRRKLDFASLEAVGSIDSEGETLFTLQVVNGNPVGPQGIDKGADGSELHPRVAGEDRRGRRARGSAQSRNGR